MSRIGIVTNWSASGAGEVSRSIAQFLKSNNFEVYIYARNEPEFKESLVDSSNFPVYVGKLSYSPIPKSINRRDFKKWINNNDIKILIYNEQQDFQAVKWGALFGCKTIAYVDFYTEATIKHFELYDALICNTIRHFNAFSWHENAWYLPWGVNLNNYEKIRNREFHGYFFHSCGTSPYRKGTDILIRALLFDRSLKVTIHSQLPLVEILPQLANEICELKKFGNLIEICETIEPPSIYSNYQFYIYPSRLDGLGLTVLESLASGIPVITTDAAPMNEFVSASRGSLIKPSKRWARSDSYYWPMEEITHVSLAQKMKELEKIDPVEYNSLRRNCISYVDEYRDIFKNFASLPEQIKKISLMPSNYDKFKNINIKNYFPIKYRNSYAIIIFFLYCIKSFRKMRNSIS